MIHCLSHIKETHLIYLSLFPLVFLRVTARQRRGDIMSVSKRPGVNAPRSPRQLSRYLKMHLKSGKSDGTYGSKPISPLPQKDGP